MDKSKVTEVHQAMAAAMREVAAKHGFKLAPTKCTFGTDTIKITATLLLVEGENAVSSEFEPQYVAHLNKWGHNWGLTKEMLGREISTVHGTMIFHGTRGTSTKYLILATKVGNQKYRFAIGQPQASLYIAAIKAAV